jgi:hypothetical protein
MKQPKTLRFFFHGNPPFPLRKSGATCIISDSLYIHGWEMQSLLRNADSATQHMGRGLGFMRTKLFSTGINMRALLGAGLFALAALGAMQCTTDDAATAPTIAILAPKAGQTFKATDTVLVITQSDYSKFTSGLNFNYSIDSGKTWNFLPSLPRGGRTGIVKDTLAWVAGADVGVLAAGQGVSVQVLDYNKKFIAISGFFFISN